MQSKALPLVVALALLAPPSAVFASPGETQLVSVVDPSLRPVTGSGASAANTFSLSSDGRYVAFASEATDLVADDSNHVSDVFVRDMQTGVTSLVSVDGTGAPSNGVSTSPALSADGHYVAFESYATDLVVGDTDPSTDIFVRNLQTGITTLVSVDSTGSHANGFSFNPSISADGRYVAFGSSASNLAVGDTNAAYDVFVRDTQTGTTTLVSVDSAAAQGIGYSLPGAISADGRYVAFYSSAGLVADDTNGSTDIFVRDTQTGTTTRASVDSAGGQSNGNSFSPTISAGGRYVAFSSNAATLVSGDTNHFSDVFVRDVQMGTTTRASVDSAGGQSGGHSYNPTINADGRYVVFSSDSSNLVADDTNNNGDVFVRDLLTGVTSRVSPDSIRIQGMGSAAAISADGRFVAFDSDASSVVAGDTNERPDVFVRDMQSGASAVASARDASVPLAAANARSSTTRFAVSIDGRYVAFESDASNLVPGDTNDRSDVFVRDRQTGTTTLASRSSRDEPGQGPSDQPALSMDGRWVAFVSSSINLVPGDTNQATDVFVRDLQAHTTTLVSVGSSGVAGDGYSAAAAISADGRFVAFTSAATNLVAGDTNDRSDVFVRDLLARSTTLVSVGSGGVPSDGYSSDAAVSGDGRYIAFNSDASNIVAGDTNARYDIFIRDLQTSTTTLVSRGSDGAESDGNSFESTVSPDGRYVAFHSGASNLVPGDTNDRGDVFVRDLQTGTTRRASVDSAGAESDGQSHGEAISADGRYVAFLSDGSNLVPDDTNDTFDVFVHDLQMRTTTRVSRDSTGAQTHEPFYNVAISGDGRYLAFDSYADDLPAGDRNGTSDVFVYETGAPSASVGPLVSAVLPLSRSVQVGQTATAFATIINAGSADGAGCKIVPLTPVPAAFFFQTTNPATNVVSGVPDTSVGIDAGAAQSFVIALTPHASIAPTEVELRYVCDFTDAAAVVSGVNTLLIVADANPVPDIIALSATLANDGVVRASPAGVFAVAVSNVGAGGTIDVSADTGATTVPVAIALCQTNPVTSACVNPLTATTGVITVNVASGETPTFGVFVARAAAFPYDPAKNRIFVRFRDSAGGVVRGTTSVAVDGQ